MSEQQKVNSNLGQDIFNLACSINDDYVKNLAAVEPDLAYVESFSDWLYANNDALPAPESFHEYLERYGDSISPEHKPQLNNTN